MPDLKSKSASEISSSLSQARDFRSRIAKMVAPMLMALDGIRDKLTPEELSFIPRAWRATFEKAKSLGWLK